MNDRPCPGYPNCNDYCLPEHKTLAEEIDRLRAHNEFLMKEGGKLATENAAFRQALELIVKTRDEFALGIAKEALGNAGSKS